ncbi:class I SAM-dependent methyltransferase [Cognatilysobacter lacus]|uniref:S-adenosyl-L-methionine-dependent methyltransferase n=1 Tax=Cognatilysobacter lacus TaxID=1643323 RepID=A0A5D8Z7E9_9GAMM|nr:SAM-dependent methyltransferase [Lysobacter lacus]TZF90610.1 class I SAM-dependent methyltransferase [Lysobacter lacus]
MTDDTPVRNVSDTALWVAIYRAMESERSDAIFLDPYARRLGGERGERIVREMPRGRSMAWPMIVRTAVMDEIVMRCIRDGARTVLNLAAGLDARPYRLDLPKDLRWMHVDLPDILGYFRDAMAGEAPRCQLEFHSADLRDPDVRRALFADAATTGPVLVISEGLLVYLEPDDVAALARDLHDVAHARWWLTDLASPLLLKKVAKHMGANLRAGNAPFRFAPAEGTAWFASMGWREREFRSTWDESLRLKRSVPLAPLWTLLTKLQPREKRDAMRRMSGIVLMENND